MAASPAQQVEKLLGAPLTVDAPGKLAAFALDGAAPQVAAFPESPEQVGELLALASSNGWGVVPWGGGHGMGAGAAPTRYDLALCLARLDKLLEHDADNLTLIGESGLILDDANRRTASARQFLPLGFSGDRGTLGGMVAAARPSPKRLLYGDVRDLLIGIRVALPDGSLVRYGRKVIKNVAGYDMNKLFLGSQGMLGVIVETIFKLSALPDEEGCLPGAFPDFGSAASAARALAASAFTPSYLLLLDAGMAGALRAEGSLQAPEGEVLLLVGFEGRALALRRQVEGAMHIVEQQGGKAAQPLGPIPPSAGALLSATLPLGALLSATLPLGAPLSASLPAGGHMDSAGSADGPPAPALRLRIGTTPGNMARLCDRLRQSLEALGMQTALVADYGAGALRAVLPWPEAAQLRALTEWLQELRSDLQSEQGYVALVSAPAALKQAGGVWGDLGGEARIMALIKARLDPKGIMAPGRFLPD